MWRAFSYSFCAVLLILALLVFWDLLPSGESAKPQKVWADFNAISRALDIYREGCGCFPSNEEGLTALLECPSSHPAPEQWKQLANKAPKDPWMNDYQYRLHGSGDSARFEIWTPGKDGKPGTKDDVSSLDE